MNVLLFLGAHSAAGIDAHPEHPGLVGGAGRHAVLQGPWAGSSRSSRSFRSFPSRLSPRVVHHCCCSDCGGLLALNALIVLLTFNILVLPVRPFFPVTTLYTSWLTIQPPATNESQRTPFELFTTLPEAPNNKGTLCIKHEHHYWYV